MANQVSDFFENTTKVFSGVITHNDANPDTTNDVIKFMIKPETDTTDASAVINVSATGLGSGGIFTITLSSTVTQLTPKQYYYELIWYIASSAGIHLLDQGTLRVLDRYQDQV